MGGDDGARPAAQWAHPLCLTQEESLPDVPDGYENLTRIAEGGFATVYRGLDTRFNRTIVLKVLRAHYLEQERLERFTTECLATGRLSSHPNIVTLYDAGTTRRACLAGP